MELRGNAASYLDAETGEQSQAGQGQEVGFAVYVVGQAVTQPGQFLYMLGLPPALPTTPAPLSPVFLPPLGAHDSQQHSGVRGGKGQGVALCHRAVRSKGSIRRA